jgi:hypothetical protein
MGVEINLDGKWGSRCVTKSETIFHEARYAVAALLAPLAIEGMGVHLL